MCDAFLSNTSVSVGKTCYCNNTKTSGLYIGCKEALVTTRKKVQLLNNCHAKDSSRSIHFDAQTLIWQTSPFRAIEPLSFISLQLTFRRYQAPFRHTVLRREKVTTCARVSMLSPPQCSEMCSVPEMSRVLGV